MVWLESKGQNWTPTVTQSGNVTVTVNRAEYYNRGPLVQIVATVTVTGSGTISNTIRIGNLPYTASHSGSYETIGTFNLLDSGSFIYNGVLILWTTTEVVLQRDGATGYLSGIALAANDVISIQGEYERA